jgi:tetratricopeptide (TPR) repeat protein
MLVCIVHASCQTAPNPLAPVLEALRQRDFAAAQKLSESLLSTQPGSYPLWTLHGMATAGMGSQQDALKDFQNALRLQPSYLPALEGAAQAKFLLGSPDTRGLLNQILARHPDDQTTHLLLGRLDYRAGDCTQAIQHFANAETALATQPQALTEHGACLSALGRPDAAVVAFERALNLNPSQFDARYNLALALLRDQKPEDALNTLRPLLKSSPVNSDALTLSAEILETKDDTTQAVALLRKAILADPANVDAYLQFAALSFDHASPQVGIEILSAGLTQVPREPRLYLARGILLTQIGEFIQAADDFDTASRINPRTQFLGLAQGLVESQEHNPAEALVKFRAAARQHPNDAYAHYLLAEALSEEGPASGSPGYEEEVRTAMRAVELDPKLVAARDLLSSIYLENGQIDLVIEQSKAAIAATPTDEQAIYHLIVALRKKNEKDQLPTLLNRLVELREKSTNSRIPGKRYRLTIAPDRASISNP